MIVLDTNVLSELMRPTPHPAVALRLHAQSSPADLWTTTVTMFELRFGLACLPPGRRRSDLEAALDRVFITILNGRVCGFDLAAADATALIAVRCHSAGRPIGTADAMIAGTVAAYGAGLATRNTRHFVDAGIPLVDPWASTP